MAVNSDTAVNGGWDLTPFQQVKVDPLGQLSSVLPHPRGRAASHLDWEQRSALLADRLVLTWY